MKSPDLVLAVSDPLAVEHEAHDYPQDNAFNQIMQYVALSQGRQGKAMRISSDVAGHTWEDSVTATRIDYVAHEVGDDCPCAIEYIAHYDEGPQGVLLIVGVRHYFTTTHDEPHTHYELVSRVSSSDAHVPIALDGPFDCGEHVKRMLYRVTQGLFYSVDQGQVEAETRI